MLAKYEIKPEHIADYKALKGDPSDNIPGVKGIGEKTAVKLIQQFGSIEQIYEHLNEVTPPKLQALLRDNAERCPPEQDPDDDCHQCAGDAGYGGQRMPSHYNRSKVADLFRELEFASLLNKLPEGEREADPAGKTKRRPQRKPRLRR